MHFCSRQQVFFKNDKKVMYVLTLATAFLLLDRHLCSMNMKTRLKYNVATSVSRHTNIS